MLPLSDQFHQRNRRDLVSLGTKSPLYNVGIFSISAILYGSIEWHSWVLSEDYTTIGGILWSLFLIPEGSLSEKLTLLSYSDSKRIGSTI